MSEDYRLIEKIRNGMKGFDNINSLFVFTTLFRNIDIGDVRRIVVDSATYLPFLEGAVEYHKLDMEIEAVGNDDERFVRRYEDGGIVESKGDPIALARSTKKTVYVEIHRGEEKKVYSFMADADECFSIPINGLVIAEYQVRGKLCWQGFANGTHSTSWMYGRGFDMYSRNEYSSKAGFGIQETTDGKRRIFPARLTR